MQPVRSGCGARAGVLAAGGRATMWRLGLCPVGGGGERFPWLLPCVFGEARHNSVLLMEASWTGMDPGEEATMRDPGQVGVTGPLAEYAEGFRAELAAQGYVRDAAARLLHLMAGLSGLIATTGVDEADLLSTAPAEEFLRAPPGGGSQ